MDQDNRSAASPASASAENWFSWRPWASHTAQNIRWPEQFLDHDRSAARVPFAAMIANGWRAQNTISTYHFNEITGELNDTGRLKVRAGATGVRRRRPDRRVS